MPPKRSQAALRMSCGTIRISGSQSLPPTPTATAPTADRHIATATPSRTPSKEADCFFFFFFLTLVASPALWDDGCVATAGCSSAATAGSAPPLSVSKLGSFEDTDSG